MPSTMRSPILGEPPPLSWADAFNSSPRWARFFGRRAQLSSYGRHRRSNEPSFLKGELKAQSISYFLNAPLKTDRIARTRNYCRLPSISMVPANADLYLTYAQRRDDHVG
jgi:hypothetical protein